MGLSIKMWIDLTIVIVNWNGGDLLRDCLSSIAVARQHLQIQVIVVDNASRDGSREMAESGFPQFEVLNSGGNLGFGKANNLSRTRVQSDLVLFLNPDTVLLENSLVPMVEFMRQHSEVGGLGCRMLYPNGEIQEQGLQYVPTPWTEFLSLLFLSTGTRRRFRKLLPWLDPNQSAYATKLYGGCLLCRKAVLDQVGWFDERYFMYVEDVDLCLAILKRGWRLYYLSSADIIHVGGGASKQASNGFSILMKSESFRKFMGKHYGAWGAWFYQLGILAGSSFRFLVLIPLFFLSLILRIGAGTDFPSAFFKYRTLTLWAMGLKKPAVSA
jgi:GT2 family glycosyltransferase